LTPTTAATAVSLAAAVTVTLVGIAFPEVVAAAGPVTLVAGFLLGLPHGAADHLVPRWAVAGRLRRAGMVTVVAGYVTAAGLAWAALSLVGPWALPLMMLVSLVHFGLGDVVTEAQRDFAPAPTGWELAVAVFARGGPSIVLPLVCWPGTLDAALNAFDPKVTALLSPPVRAVLLALLGVACVVTGVQAWRAGRRLVVVELVVLLALFASTPPLAAFGVYFGAWHSLRHLARMLEADPRNAADLGAGRWGAPVRRFVAAAAVPTTAALIATAALVAVAAQTPLLVPMLSILLALTVPHVVFVAILDEASGCWDTIAARGVPAGRGRRYGLPPQTSARPR
jgi:Brp/Blh family beta-carotene 15,15'-monooxygenase